MSRQLRHKAGVGVRLQGQEGLARQSLEVGDTMLTVLSSSRPLPGGRVTGSGLRGWGGSGELQGPRLGTGVVGPL